MSGKRKSRYFTIIIAPHNETNGFSIRIPLWLCQAACLGLLIGLSGIFIMAYHYRELHAMSQENSYLKEIHRVHEEDLDKVTRESEEIFKKMKEIECMSEDVEKLLESDSLENTNN